MYQKSINKKAVSPLIATVLLIAFAIALGAIVMNWGKTYVEGEMESGTAEYYASRECDRDIRLSIKDVARRPQLCYNHTGDEVSIRFMVENAGPRTVEGIRLTVFGTNGGVYQTDETHGIERTQIPPGQILLNTTTFDVDSETFGTVAQVEFTAYLETTGQAGPHLCSNNPLIRTGTALAPCR